MNIPKAITAPDLSYIGLASNPNSQPDTSNVKSCCEARNHSGGSRMRSLYQDQCLCTMWSHSTIWGCGIAAHVELSATRGFLTPSGMQTAICHTSLHIWPHKLVMEEKQLNFISWTYKGLHGISEDTELMGFAFYIHIPDWSHPILRCFCMTSKGGQKWSRKDCKGWYF